MHSAGRGCVPAPGEDGTSTDWGQPFLEELHADAHLRRRRQPGWINSPYVCVLLILGQHAFELATFQTGPRVPHRAQDDAVSVDCPAMRDLAVICRKRSADAHRFCTVGPIQLPAAELLIALADDDAFMVRQVGEARRSPPL